MKAVVKIKLSSERVKLIAQLKAKEISTLERILVSKRVQDIVKLLKGDRVTATTEAVFNDADTLPDLSPFERIVRDNEITLETLKGAVESTQMLLNSATTPQVFIDAVEVVSAKVSDGSLLDSLGQDGVDLVSQLIFTLDGAKTIPVVDANELQNTPTRSIDLIHDLLRTSNWIQGNNGVYSNAQESFSIRLSGIRSSSFDVEIYQNLVCIQTMTTNGDFVESILDFINEYIQIEANKLLLQKTANDVVVPTEVIQSQIKVLDEIEVVDVIAQGASTSVVNTGENPTQEQLEANNYKTAKVVIAGMHIAIENPIGSVRRGVDADGQAWETQMTAHYGYFEGTIGADGDELDVFVLPNTPVDYEGRVFVISQIDKYGNFDEHKVILGATSKVIANQVYRSHYDENFNGQGSIVEMSVDDFKTRTFTQGTAMFDSVHQGMLDSWLDDGRYDLMPFIKLNLSRLWTGEKEPKPTMREPIVVYVVGSKNYVIQGRKRIELAVKNNEDYIPSILVEADKGYTQKDIDNAIRKCGNVVHAEALGAMIEHCATQRAEKELV